MVGKIFFSRAIRILGVTAIAAGVWVLAQRLMALSAATSEAVLLVARGQAASRGPNEADARRRIASSGSIRVITDNLANARTPAFKRRRSDIDGLNHAVNHPLDLTQGPLENTGNPLDVAIQGDGFFRIKIDPALGNGEGYTRLGSFIRNPNGDLVVNLGAGYELIPPVNLPSGATNISIEMDGSISYVQAGSNLRTKAGQILMARFMTPEALATVNGVYTETDASGTPVLNNPGEGGTGTLIQGFLEQSNVDPVKEYATLQEAEHSW